MIFEHASNDMKGLGKASVAVTRKLGIRLWIMLRDEIDYQEFCRWEAEPLTGKKSFRESL